jgi:hypothetical protein
LSHSAFDILKGEGLRQFNTKRGHELTNSEDPDIEYRFPDTDIEVYSYDPSFTDLIHAFRPSKDYIVQATHRGFARYFEGSEQQMETLDKKLTEELQGLDSSEYYKTIDMAETE